MTGDAMLTKRLSDITVDDLKRLIDDGVAESKHIDYKRELSLEQKDAKLDFLRDVSAFANAAGAISSSVWKSPAACRPNLPASRTRILTRSCLGFQV
jgi:hypothetical protein